MVTLTADVTPVANETPKPVIAFPAAIRPDKDKNRQSFNHISPMGFLNVHAVTNGTDWWCFHKQNIFMARPKISYDKGAITTNAQSKKESILVYAGCAQVSSEQVSS